MNLQCVDSDLRLDADVSND